MEFTEAVKVVEPKSGRICKVFLTDEEVIAILTIGVTTMMQAGLVSFTQQRDGVDLSKLDTSDTPTQ